MTRISRISHGRAFVALGLACLAGCQSWNRRPATPPPPPGVGVEGMKVSSVQAADMEIALGRAAERQGDLGRAAAAYREALKRDHRRADAYVRLAILHDQQGQFRESAELYREALRRAPGEPDIFCDMGYSLY